MYTISKAAQFTVRDMMHGKPYLINQHANSVYKVRLYMWICEAIMW